MNAVDTTWRAGTLDARGGPARVLFGRMYEDPAIELAAFGEAERVFCIASAGSTALALCVRHAVVACDINPAQLAYAARRIAGAPIEVGAAERIMGFGRALMPLAGWSARALTEFLALDDPGAQQAFFREHLDTWLFRTGFDALMSAAALRAAYSPALLDVLPRRFGAVLRSRIERGLARHPNRTNPYAHALLVGATSDDAAPPPPRASAIELVHADAAGFLETCPPASFDGFTLSNVLDGASPAYRGRLADAVRRAARPRARVVLRSFAEPKDTTDDLAAEDRAWLWGSIVVRDAARFA